jgi:hypothetical protein
MKRRANPRLVSNPGQCPRCLLPESRHQDRRRDDIRQQHPCRLRSWQPSLSIMDEEAARQEAERLAALRLVKV